MSYHIATRPVSRLTLLAALAVASLTTTTAKAQYVQTNLVSNIPGLAANADPQLRNPWGISFGPTTPFWISDANAGVSTLYNGLGVKQALVVTIPGPGGSVPGVPTGQVFNSTGAFAMTGGTARFMFASATGNIAAWNPGLGSAAANVVLGPQGSSYTGLAIGGSGESARLYAANFGLGRVDVFDGSFAAVGGGFVDPTLPAGYSPFNVQNVGGNIVVTYAIFDPATGEDLDGAGHGIVDVYDANGTLLRRVATMGALNSPWGVALAPTAFGPFGGALLVGNLGDGTINAFDFFTGMMLGTISDINGNPLVNDGLWGITFGNGQATADPNSLYIAAGINDEQDGLFARITATPEPGSLVLLATGLGVVLIGVRRRTRG
jgi:uncharacterized protein (TIGR03118 family)